MLAPEFTGAARILRIRKARTSNKVRAIASFYYPDTKALGIPSSDPGACSVLYLELRNLSLHVIDVSLCEAGSPGYPRGCRHGPRENQRAAKLLQVIAFFAGAVSFGHIVKASEPVVSSLLNFAFLGEARRSFKPLTITPGDAVASLCVIAPHHWWCWPCQRLRAVFQLVSWTEVCIRCSDS